MVLFTRKKEYEILTIRTALHEEMERKDDHSKTFISRASLRKVWTDERLKGFGRLYGAYPDAEMPHIRKNLLQTLSILVDIRWNQWAQFRSAFLDHDRRTDADIPRYKAQELERFLGLEVQTLGPGWRLPSLRTEEIGKGGYGTVTKELIATRHLRYEDSSKPPDKPIPIACKRFNSHIDFEREKKNLQILQDQLRAARGIVPFFTTITIDKQFNLFFECAYMDLEEFLSSRHDNIKLKDLMAESAELAGALASLQEDIDPQLLFCHMDLKPANILVFKNPNLPRGWEWKISDFGISIITAAQEPRALNASGDGVTFPFPFMALRGTYQSPEVATGSSFGRKSDVWSLGCILIRILAFGLGHGPDELAELDEIRARTDNGRAYYEHDFFHRGNPPVLNPHVKAWLHELPNRRNTGLSPEVLIGLRDLLLNALEIDINDRPSAWEIKNRLRRISKRLELATPSSNAPEPLHIFDSRDISQKELTPSTPPDIQPSADLIKMFLENAPATLHRVVDWVNPEEIFEAPNGKTKDRLLILAMRYRSYEAVDKLLDREDVDKESPSSDGHTPLNYAIELADNLLVGRLLQVGVDINAPSRTGITPLMQATRSGHLELVRVLLAQGANCMATSNLGFTCLHLVAYAPKYGEELIQEFRARMSIDTYSSITYETPLSLLIRELDRDRNAEDEWWAKFNAFFDAEADVNARDVDGKTPLYHAVRNNLNRVAATLRRHNARMGTRHPSEYPDWSPSQAMNHLMHTDPELKKPSQNIWRRLSNTGSFRS